MSNDLTFSPERAARGEPVQKIVGFRWLDVHYVGLSKDGSPVIEATGVEQHKVESKFLRMKPMPTKKWVLEFASEAAAQWAHSAIRLANATGPVGYGIPPIKEVEIQPEK